MIKLNLIEISELHKELKNLLSEQTISFVTKYDITKALDKVIPIAINFEKMKFEIIKKNGNLVNEPQKSYTLNGSENEKKGIEELEKLSGKKEDFNFKFKMDDFKELKSAYPYRFIFKFFND